MHESYKFWVDNECPKVFCGCGCGGEIVIKEHHRYYGIPKYISGHHPQTEETRQKMSKAQSGENHPLFGKHHSEETKQKISEANFGKHHSEETKQKISEANFGENHPLFGKFGKDSPNFGKHHSEETKQKMRKPKLGKHHSEETKQKMSKALSGENNPNFGKHHSEETRQKMREANLGENHPNWQGGITPLNTKVRYSNKYQEWRLQIFGRDNFTCQACGIRGIYLEVHHIKPLNEIIKEYNIKDVIDSLNCKLLWDLTNGITYCIKCHDKLKKKGGIL